MFIEGSFAEVGWLIKGRVIFGLLTPDMASRNDARHGIVSYWIWQLDVKSDIVFEAMFGFGEPANFVLLINWLTSANEPSFDHDSWRSLHLYADCWTLYWWYDMTLKLIIYCMYVFWNSSGWKAVWEQRDSYCINSITVYKFNFPSNCFLSAFWRFTWNINFATLPLFFIHT